MPGRPRLDPDATVETLVITLPPAYIARIDAAPGRNRSEKVRYIVDQWGEPVNSTRKTTYTAYAMNDQGAAVNVGIDMDNAGGGKRFTSIKAAAATARRELGKGWTVYIITDGGQEVETFTVSE